MSGSLPRAARGKGAQPAFRGEFASRAKSTFHRVHKTVRLLELNTSYHRHSQSKAPISESVACHLTAGARAAPLIFGSDMAATAPVSLLERAAAAALRSVAPLATAKLPEGLASLGAQGAALRQLALASSRLLVITGAGISTSSGIPDYRSPGRPTYNPLKHQEFMAQESVRRRYWARSFVGWPRMRHAAPNAGHKALVALERAMSSRRGATSDAAAALTVITQNVDRLHHRAGSSSIIELHGTIHEVNCLECNCTLEREAVQARMEVRNRVWHDHFSALAAPRPDGDVDLPVDSYQSFAVPTCPACGGSFLKPAVIFHGGSVPAPVTAAATAAVDAADAVLVVGSTATVYSAFRLVRRAAEDRRIPVGVINFGETRADPLAAFKIEAEIGSVLAHLAEDVAAAEAERATASALQ